MINIILLLTFNKTQSANLNEKYALKVGNDFSYQGVNSAELAVLKKFENARNKLKLKETRGRVLHQLRARTAMFPSGANQTIKNQTSQAEKVDLAKEKQRLLEKLNQGGE